MTSDIRAAAPSASLPKSIAYSLPNFESPYNSKTHENHKMKSDFEKIAKEYNSKYAVQNQDIKWDI